MMNDALDRLEITLDVERIVNLAQITIYPVETAGAVQVIWTAQTVLSIAPGTTRVIYGNFRDDNGERVGATEVVTPVASTDYIYEYNGVDVTASGLLTVTPVIEATRVEWTLENTSGWATFDVTLLQIRGKPIRVYDPITIEDEDSTSQTAYEVRGLRLDLPLQSDLALARSYTQYLIGRFADPVLVAGSMGFDDRDVINGVNLFSLNLMDKVRVTDSQSGMDGDVHWLVAAEYDIRSGGKMGVSFLLELASDIVYCFLDRVGYSELDSVRVGF